MLRPAGRLRHRLAEHVVRDAIDAEAEPRPWAELEGRRTGADPDELSRRTAQTLMIMSQGFLANRCLFGWLDAEQYLSTAQQAFAATT